VEDTEFSTPTTEMQSILGKRQREEQIEENQKPNEQERETKRKRELPTEEEIKQDIAGWIDYRKKLKGRIVKVQRKVENQKMNKAREKWNTQRVGLCEVCNDYLPDSLLTPCYDCQESHCSDHLYLITPKLWNIMCGEARWYCESCGVFFRNTEKSKTKTQIEKEEEEKQ